MVDSNNFKELINPKFSKRGFIQVFYGYGKGKTTASLGAAFRALGHSWKVLLIMYTKGKHIDDLNYYGEINTIKKRTQKSEFRIEQYGPERVLYYNDLSNRMIDVVKNGWEVAKEEINSGNCDLIILDELHIVLEMNIIEIDDVIKTIKNKPSHVEIITTGRSKIDELIEIADLVTEMKEIKHYYKKNIKARKGIEY